MATSMVTGIPPLHRSGTRDGLARCARLECDDRAGQAGTSPRRQDVAHAFMGQPLWPGQRRGNAWCGTRLTSPCLAAPAERPHPFPLGTLPTRRSRWRRYKDDDGNRCRAAGHAAAAPASPTMTTRRTFLLSQPLRRFPCRRRKAAFWACSIASTRSDAMRANDCASSMLGKYSGMR